MVAVVCLAGSDVIPAENFRSYARVDVYRTFPDSIAYTSAIQPGLTNVLRNVVLNIYVNTVVNIYGDPQRKKNFLSTAENVAFTENLPY